MTTQEIADIIYRESPISMRLAQTIARKINVDPRFVVEENEGPFNWVVRNTLTNKIVAYFERHYDARRHADKCKV